MTKAEFNQLTSQEKATLCKSEGDFINFVHYYSQKVILYAFNNWHVEMFFSLETNV